MYLVPADKLGEFLGHDPELVKPEWFDMTFRETSFGATMEVAGYDEDGELEIWFATKYSSFWEVCNMEP